MARSSFSFHFVLAKLQKKKLKYTFKNTDLTAKVEKLIETLRGYFLFLNSFLKFFELIRILRYVQLI